MSTAKMKNVSISPQKVRILAKKMRGLNIQKALDKLAFSKKKCSLLLKKLLSSAVANAEHNEGKDIDELVVKSILVDEAPSLKRIKARAKGKANRIIKRNSHISIDLQTVTEFTANKKKKIEKIKEDKNGPKS